MMSSELNVSNFDSFNDDILTAKIVNLLKSLQWNNSSERKGEIKAQR